MSDRPAHTPGPWRIELDTAHDGNISVFASAKDDAWFGIADVDVRDDPDDTRSPFREHALANAVLIAAAPELLAALRLVLASAFPNEREHPAMFAAWRVAEAAISKAEGR